VVDEQGRTLLAHRGRIGGGRKNIGSELFWSNYDGKRLTVWDGDRETEVAAVAEIGSPRFLRQIQFFVYEVERIKALAARDLSDGQSTGRSGHTGSARFELKSLGKEFEGIKTYRINREVNAVCDHGPIVEKLRKLLRSRGYSTGKDKLRDLYVYHGRKVTSLFEVKPSADRQSIYSAVGQLLLHSANVNPRSRLILVTPDGISPNLQSALRRIGIETLGFKWARWRTGLPRIEGLKVLVTGHKTGL